MKQSVAISAQPAERQSPIVVRKAVVRTSREQLAVEADGFLDVVVGVLRVDRSDVELFRCAGVRAVLESLLQCVATFPNASLGVEIDR